MGSNNGGSQTGWAEAGAETVGPGVHRIPLPLPTDGLAAVNVYAIEDRDGLVLVDSGWAIAESRDRLVAGLAEVGYELGDVRRFLITHVHRDHYTQSVVLRREFGMRVALGIGEQPALRATRTQTEVLQSQIILLRRAGADAVVSAIRALGLVPLSLDEWDDPDEWLVDGQVLELADRDLTVVATPGHTQGHVVFADRTNRLLFAGDHVLPHITPSIGFEPGNPESRPLGDYLDSLALMHSFGPYRLLPAHGPVGTSVAPRVAELRAHHNERLARTREGVESGRHTAYEVARGLTWTRRERPFDSLDAMNQMLATTETKAHLDVLVDDGALVCSEQEGVDLYRVNSAVRT